MKNMKLRRVALITGASSGIGKATALKFADEGIRVALIARRKDKLEELKSEIENNNGVADYFVADVGCEDESRRITAWAIDTFGQVDILVNNAGILRPGKIESQSCQEWRDTLDINLLAPMYLSQAVIPSMKLRESGHIVNVSSTAAKVALDANLSSYTASKYGITAFSGALRKEVANYGIRVTIIEPGTTETEVAKSIPDEQAREFIDSCVHQEIAMKAEDIAEAIFYAVNQPERVNVNELWLTPTRQ